LATPGYGKDVHTLMTPSSKLTVDIVPTVLSPNVPQLRISKDLIVPPQLQEPLASPKKPDAKLPAKVLRSAKDEAAPGK